jgi:hypothetical protein
LQPLKGGLKIPLGGGKCRVNHISYPSPRVATRG